MARPGSRVRPLETPGNRRPREMIVAPLNSGEQNPAYRLSSTRVFLSSSYGPDFLGQAYVAEACRNKAPSFQPPEVEFAGCALFLLVGYQRVERGVGDVRMSERGLHEPQVLDGPQQPVANVCRKRCGVQSATLARSPQRAVIRSMSRRCG